MIDNTIQETNPTAQAAPRRSSAARLRKERHILESAERHFAQYGFEGASLDDIAQNAGISRHNLLYYFASKEALYQHILHDVLDQWLNGMHTMLASEDPAVALRAYIRSKLQFSRKRPHGSKVFTREVMAGAPRFGHELQMRVAPVLENHLCTFERWVQAGKIAPVNFTHLLFILWSVTQAYADQQAQFTLFLGRQELTAADFEDAERLIYQLVIQGLSTDTTPSAPAAAVRAPAYAQV